MTAAHMHVQLKHLAKQGRRDDCLALMQELGDWQSRDPHQMQEVLFLPHLDTEKG
ncbi:MAG: hypothetical protein VKK03_03105 [Synechococcus sp.]|nr:hypothetical protein [Synechococcus sp.]